MNKILATLALALSIATISCATLEETVVDPMKVVVAQVTSPEGPSRAEFTSLRLKVERLEKLLERQIESVDSLNYAKANHSHPARNNVDRDHRHSQYLEKDYLGFGESYATRDHRHSQYLEKGSYSGFGGGFAERGHTHDYASRNHSHGGGFGGGFP